jgi:hypothetical protein
MVKDETIRRYAANEDFMASTVVVLIGKTNLLSTCGRLGSRTGKQTG